ncbi:MAG: dihydroorotate dehydrogenase electron transfer subunit [Calditrichaeota bacterium]|nr:dihydroorotate dehydrogenase electron transfer subunit [Calditrichota bacterium]
MGIMAGTTARLATGKIIEKFSITNDIKKLRIYHPETAKSALPGQFVNIRTSGSNTPLLRRPFSINLVHRKQGWFDILFRVIGRGTVALAQFESGAEVDFIGPLGNSFSFPEKKETAILVAGGLGIAPLEFLGQIFSERNISAHLFWGNQTQAPFVYQENFSQKKIRTSLATDDGSFGFHGNVIQLIEKELSHFSSDKIRVYACGPNPMLRALKNFTRGKNIACEASLETMMACGFGVCMGCNVAKADNAGYFYVCQDGPVFDLKDIRIHG